MILVLSAKSIYAESVFAFKMWDAGQWNEKIARSIDVFRLNYFNLSTAFLERGFTTLKIYSSACLQ